MTCEQARQHIADSLQDELEAPALLELRAHLESCESCRDEARAIERAWASLDLLEDEEPGPALRGSFYQTLEAYRQGLEESKRAAEAGWLTGWWPRRPVFQIGACAAALVIGLGMGRMGTGRGADEISRLRGEIHDMRQLVTLSLLQQQSASERLRGVTWSYRVEQSDTEVLAALLHTLNQDPNVNVRLSAVDAIENFSDSPVARKGLVQALGKQSSPLVQVAIIGLVRKLREQQAMPSLRSLLAREDLDENVRSRAEAAVRELGRDFEN